MRYLKILISLPLVILATSLPAHDVVDDMYAAADAFLDALDKEQKEKAMFEFKDDERLNWHYIPRERNGLPIKEMRPDQVQLAFALLGSALSNDGFRKTAKTMSLERILWELENKAARRDAELYFVSIFGAPSKEKTWGWRFEGHHLSINFTIVDGKKISGTPIFFGANPGEVKEGPRKGLRVLEREEDLGRAVVKSLNKEQAAKAIIGDEAPKDIFTTADRKVSPLEPKGILMSELDKEQRAMLVKLIQEYVFTHRLDLAREDMTKIREAGFGKVSFAWMGSLEPGEGHYYRVQGPTFLLEYDNIQNGANHPHAVWRDFDGDFGEDLLRKHHAEAH